VVTLPPALRCLEPVAASAFRGGAYRALSDPDRASASTAI
jgi:hypothetical protein